MWDYYDTVFFSFCQQILQIMKFFNNILKLIVELNFNIFIFLSIFLE